VRISNRVRLCERLDHDGDLCSRYGAQAPMDRAVTFLQLWKLSGGSDLAAVYTLLGPSCTLQKKSICSKDIGRSA
jgi:hypothetical protein